MSNNEGFIINSQLVEAPKDIIVKNYLHNSEVRFKYSARTKPLQHLVLHETAGKSAEGCKGTLITHGYGVQLILARDGTLSCHGDLATDIMIHGNQLNATSIGIEVVNPYAPSIAGSMNYQTIPAEWWTWCPDKTNKNYVLPSEAQLNTLKVIVPWLCEKLGISYEFPTKDLCAKKRKILGWKKPPLGWYAKPSPGIVAHQDYSTHADGRYLLEYLLNHTN